MNKHEILAIKDCKIESFNVPQWGIDLNIKKLNGKERQSLRDWQAGLNDADKANQLILVIGFIIRTVCDESGKLIFDANDFDALAEKDFDVLCDIFNFGYKLNGFVSDDNAKKN